MPVAPPQLDLFPERPLVERLDPRAHVGPRTGVLDLVRVRLRPADAAHLVFHDRHGWYCETHGPACLAVIPARDAAAAPVDLFAPDEPGNAEAQSTAVKRGE